MTIFRRSLSALLVAALVVALAGPARAAETVKMGDLPAISNAGLYVAIDKGYFQEKSIVVDTEKFASGGKMIAPLATGQIDVAIGSPSAGLYNSIAGGLEFRIVADKGQSRPGHGFSNLIVRKDLLDSGRVKTVKDLKGLNGATVCVAQGTTHEVTLGDYGRANGIEWKPLVFDRTDTMYQTFFGGRCDAMTQDASALAGAVTTAASNPADYVVLTQTISKEPLGPFTRNGDEVWTDIIAWLHYGLIEAEELGVTAAKADEMAKSSSIPAVQRLLGTSGDLGSRLGLDNKWMLQAIKAGGNYGEIFERNVGKASPLKLDRGLNATWAKGGLMCALPFK